jgi:single-strand DNA-binding protein
MSYLNKATLIGNVGKDPELRFTQSGTAVCDFSVATSKEYTGRDGQKHKKTQWHDITVWERLAEVCGEHLRSGRQVYVEGELGTDEWTGKDGVKRTKTKIVAYKVLFLGRSDESRPRGESRPEPDTRQDTRAPEPPPTSRYSAADDDIPF